MAILSFMPVVRPVVVARTAVLVGFPMSAESGDLRLRAKEHFEWSFIRFAPIHETRKYFGLSKTLDAWYEAPFGYAIRIGLRPYLGGRLISVARRHLELI